MGAWTAVVHRRARRRPRRNHIGARIVRARIGGRRWRSYFKFCFERDPWEKTISKYFYIFYIFADRPDPPPFRRWVLRADLPSDFDIYSLDGHTVAADFVGRYDDLEGELARVLQRIGLDADVVLTREKSGLRPARSSPGEMYDAASSARVASVFEREIATFGFTAPALDS